MSKEKIEQLRGIIAGLNREIEQLQVQYGDSIRPGWVGEEIGYLCMRRQQRQKELDALEGGAP